MRRFWRVWVTIVLIVRYYSAGLRQIEITLSKEGFVCDMMDLGEDRLEIGKLYDYDISIFDSMSPDIDGYEVLRRLRSDPRELVAPLHAIVARARGHSQSMINTGRLSVNLDSRTAEVDSRPLHLAVKEYAILELLSLRKGTTLTKDMSLNHVYGGIYKPEVKIIDVFICKLRKS